MDSDNTQPLVTHLIELRKCLLYSISAVVVIFLCLTSLSNDIYQIISSPLIKQMPSGARMIATDVTSPFFAPIKLTFWVSLIISIPIILYLTWNFISPALYRQERQLAIILLISSSIIFYVGVAFAYFIVLPMVFSFLIHTVPEGVLILTDIARYLSFVLTMFTVFGIAFEMPIAIILLCWMKVTTPQELYRKRPYILVSAFIIGMLLTPPDVFSQTLLAIPMYCLFEIGVFCSHLYIGKHSSTKSSK